jgi:hypothetical protein
MAMDRDDLREYERMREEGVALRDACRTARVRGFDRVSRIRMLRSVYKLSLLEAKETDVQESGTSTSLQEHQAALAPCLEAALSAMADEQQ